MAKKNKSIYLWCKSECGEIDIEVKVMPGGSFFCDWPFVEIEEDEEEAFDEMKLRAGLPEECPRDQRRFVADVHGWRPFDPKTDTWNPPDDYDDGDEDDIEFDFEAHWGDE